MSSKLVHGVDIDLVNENVVGQMIVKFGLIKEAPVGWPIRDRVRVLAEHIKEKTPKKDLADCDGCGGISPVTLDKCPFCGDGEITEGAIGPSKALKARFSEQDLDAAILEVQRLKIGAAKSYWKLGVAVQHIHDNNLWKLRTAKDGELQFRSFPLFCAAELGMSHSHAFKMMDVAKAFTEAQVEAFGIAKLSIMLSVPDDFRAQLLSAAEDGAPLKKLKAEVKKLPQKAATTGRKQVGKGKGGKPKGNDLVVTARLGRVTVPLKAKLTGLPARTLQDDACGDEEWDAGVVQSFRVTMNARGEIVLVIERERRE